jgi:hypothetical protein
MSSLTTTPYSLDFDTLILVRISATNSAGTSAWSVDNTSGAKVRSKPGIMSMPTKGAAISETELQITWAAATAGVGTGNSSILNYKLYWNAGTGNPSVILYEGSLLTFTQIGLTAGQLYKFQV